MGPRPVVLIVAALALAGCGGPSAPGSAEAELPVMQAALDLAAEDLVDWGCGHGFTVGTSDQTVRLTVEVADASRAAPPEPGVVAVDGEAWVGRLVTGADLFAQWCDDVIEAGEPEVIETAAYPVTGTLTWSTDGTGSCDGPATGRLTDASTLVDDEVLPLPDLELRNEFFGCFAG